MHPRARYLIVIPLLLGADLAPEPQSCGCDSPDPVSEHPGVATVTKIDPAPASEDNCAVDPVRVELDFVPDDGSPPIGDPADDRLLVSGKNPPRSFIESKGIAVGSSFACVQQFSKGSVKYRFPGIDLSGYEGDCF